MCYELKTGKPRWKHEHEVRFHDKQGGDGPRATPTIIGDRVYTVGGTGILDCIDGRTGGLTAIYLFLRRWVPLIEAAPAFIADGMLVITFDESDGAGAEGSSACCGERALPGARFQPGFSGPGGGRVGAIVLSKFVKPGTVSAVPYNHYSLLRTVEALFGLPYLGYAAEKGLQGFGVDVFSAAPPAP